MMVALRVMTYFKVSLSTRNWDRAIFFGCSAGHIAQGLMAWAAKRATMGL